MKTSIRSTGGDTVRSVETLSFTYDTLGRVFAAPQTLAGLSTPINCTFTFDEAGNRLSLAFAIGGVADLVDEYRYDNLNRLSSVSERG